MAGSIINRPHRIHQQATPDGKIRYRVVFDHDPEARYFLDPTKCVLGLEIPSGETKLMVGSDEALFLEPQPSREMSEEERMAEAESKGRSGKYDRSYDRLVEREESE